MIPSKNYFAQPVSYNTDFSSTVLEAAANLSQPFLTQQAYLQVPGATVTGSQVQFNGQTFTITDAYRNPQPVYYNETPEIFQSVWPRPDRFPNALFLNNGQTCNTFNATIDCVGFACRVLVATGGTSPSDNAFCQLHQAFTSLPGTSFPPNLGVVPEAYQFAVSLASLADPCNGWSYVAGAIDPGQIDIAGYSGQARSGFSKAEAGDILCFGFVGSGSNGHFMVLADAPQTLDLSELSAQGVDLPDFVAAAYKVSVYDSTNSGSSLHITDSRRASATSGIGYGELYLFTNNQDQPVGYIFGLENGSLQPAYFVSGTAPDYKSQIVAITLGRYQ